MSAVIEAVAVGMLALIVATLPRNALFAANLRFLPGLPWSVPLVAVLLWFFWRYMNGWGPPPDTAATRRARLRANRLAPGAWLWALLAGGLGIVTLVLILRVANRLMTLPDQAPPDLSAIPLTTLVPILLLSSLFAGVVEEASFRGYMQGMIERQFGPVIAILITGVMFAVAHLDFTPVLLPYYVAVSAIYGMVSYLTTHPSCNRPTCGNIYSNTDLARGRRSGRRRARPQSIWADRDGCGILASIGAIAVFARRYGRTSCSRAAPAERWGNPPRPRAGSVRPSGAVCRRPAASCRRRDAHAREYRRRAASGATTSQCRRDRPARPLHGVRSRSRAPARRASREQASRPRHDRGDGVRCAAQAGRDGDQVRPDARWNARGFGPDDGLPDVSGQCGADQRHAGAFR